MRTVQKTIVAASVASSLFVTGCGSTSPDSDPTAEIQKEVRAAQMRLAEVEARTAHVEEMLSKTSASLDSTSSQLRQITAESASVKQDPAVLERLRQLEATNSSLAQDVQRLTAASIATSTEPQRPSVPVERTMENLLAALEDGYRKSLTTGLSEENKLRVRAQYQYFKGKLGVGEDPRLSLNVLEGMDANSVDIVREFFPIFLPAD